jgi:hypothetical protein
MICGRELVAIGADATTIDTLGVQKDTFWGMPRESLNGIPRRNEIIIMEDMTARMGCRKDNNYPRNLEKK